MNIVELRINPYQNKNVISINGKPISSYSKLNNFIKEPLLKWGNEFFESIEYEINDDYKLIVMSDEVDNYFIKKLSKIYPSCIAYEYVKYDLDISIQERFEIINELSEKYIVGYSSNLKEIPISNNTELDIMTNTRMCVVENKNNVSISIETYYDDAKKVAKEEKANIIFCLSDEDKIESYRNSYIINISNQYEIKIVNQIVEKFYYINEIIRLINELNKNIDKLSEQDENRLKIASEIETYVYIGSITDIELGQQLKMDFKTVPENSPIPDIRVVVLNESVVCVKEDKLIGNNEGKTKVQFYKNQEVIPFAEANISVYKNRYIEKIDLNIDKNIMCVGMQQQIDYMVYPNDADDVESLVWECTNEKVVNISSDGMITAVGVGDCRISLSGRKVKQSIDIIVKSQTDSIELSLDDYECYIGNKRVIEVFMEPKDAYDMSYTWKTTDKNVAVIEKDETEVVYVQAVGIGPCTIYFTSGDGNASKKLNIQVKSTFEKQEYKHTWLRRCALSFLATIILCCFSMVWWELITAYIVGVIFTLWSAIKTIMTKSEDWFWAVLLVMICALPLLAILVCK